LKQSDFSKVVYVNPFHWDAIDKIEVFLQSNNDSRLIYTFGHDTDQLLSNNLLFFKWLNYPGAGNYTLHAVMTDRQGRTTVRDLQVNVQ